MCKMSEIRISRNYFPKVNPWTEFTSPWTASGSSPRSPSRGRLAGEWPERRFRAQNLTAVEGKWRGDGGEPHQRQERVAEGRTQRATVGNNRRRRRSVEWELRTRKHAIEGEVSVVMAGGCSSSFYSGRGAHRGGGGGNG
jgi:hypothetical protein